MANNVISLIAGIPILSMYDGYGSCPLTVEKGKVILAEFGYGGKLLPTFPLDPTIPQIICMAPKGHITSLVVLELYT